MKTSIALTSLLIGFSAHAGEPNLTCESSELRSAITNEAQKKYGMCEVYFGQISVRMQDQKFRLSNQTEWQTIKIYSQEGQVVIAQNDAAVVSHFHAFKPYDGPCQVTLAVDYNGTVDTYRK